MRNHLPFTAIALSVSAAVVLMGCGKSDQAPKAASGHESTASDHHHDDTEAGEGHASNSHESGESDHHHDVTEADVEMPANYAEAVSRIKSYRDAVREAAGSATPTAARRSLDEVDIVLRKLAAIARDSGVPAENLEIVNLSAREIRDLFNKVHAEIDAKRPANFNAVSVQMDQAIGRLEAVVPQAGR